MKKNKKNRWSDYTPPDIDNIAVINPLEPALKLRLEVKGGRPQNINFSFLRERPQIGSLFVNVMRLEAYKYARGTMCGIRGGVKKFHQFLEARRSEIKDTSSITYEVLQEFAIWLVRENNLSEAAAGNAFHCLRTILKAARRIYPEVFQPNFSIPFFIFSRSRYQESNSPVLSQVAFSQLLNAAERRVDEVIKNYRAGDVPEGPRALIPFLIIIAARTAINAESLYNIGRDCLKPHVLDATAYYVSWVKLRSKAGVQRQLHYVDSKGRGVIELIQFLMMYTEPLVAMAQEYDKGKLLLYRHKNGSNYGVALARKSDTNNRELRAFCERNSLPAVTFAQIRPTAASLYYVKTGGKLRKVQLLLGHKEINTTWRYLRGHQVHRLHDKSIRTAQDALVVRVTVVIPKEAKQALRELAGELSPEQVEKLSDGEYDTGICACRNPYDSPQAGQRKGRLCSLFMACLTCPNALFFLEQLPGVIALKKHLLAKKESMRPAVWNILYLDKLKIIEADIIGAFSEDQVREAERLSAEITYIPALMAKEDLR